VVYQQHLKLDEHFRNPMDGVDDEIRESLHELFMKRWSYVDAPIMGAAFALEPNQLHSNLDPALAGNLQTVFAEIATAEHPEGSLAVEWQDFKRHVQQQLKNLTSDKAFGEGFGLRMPTDQWYDYFVKAHWPSVAWAAKRICTQACSASACEHSWSIEDWIHTKKRNLLSQSCVEQLVRIHSNLVFERHAEDWVPEKLHWEDELEILDPERDGAEGDGENGEDSEDSD